MFKEFNIRTPEREILIDISNEVSKIVRSANISNGICHIFIPHTTAGITINENADPSVTKDIITYLNKLIPQGGSLGYRFRHGEGNSDAHIKSSLVGTSLSIFIHEKRLMLGTWQGIYFSEFDGPRNRKVYVQIQGE
ncbi:MAG: YjbQ family protein [Candidatus Lokiarchaeota archaeon]|nr:YjbQ family protein [Candidatus Lokiarchaeota archaeon]